MRYDVWRRLLKTFWAVVVGYSMVVLIAIYMYQFRSVSGLFRQIMGMSEEGWVSVHLCHKTDMEHRMYWYTADVAHPDVWIFSLRDLGFERYNTVELFARILLPATFLLACILQLHYFNSDFLTVTDLDSVPVRQASRWDSAHACIQSFTDITSPYPNPHSWMLNPHVSLITVSSFCSSLWSLYTDTHAHTLYM